MQETRSIVKKSSMNGKWFIGTAAFIIYLFAIAYFLFFSEYFGRTELYAEYRYNLIPFKEIMRYINNIERLSPFWFAINICGNIVVFVPYGFFLPIVRRRIQSWLEIVCVSVLFSLSIETIQLFTKVGIFDVDDIIMNTGGSLIGFMIYKLFKRYQSHRSKGHQQA